jgi:hypothetical protein
VDSTVVRAHQHGTTLPRHSGIPIELQDPRPGRRKPSGLVLVLVPGRGGHSSRFENFMDALKEEKTGPGAATKRPNRARADKAYSSTAIRQNLRDRGVQWVTPEKEDQNPPASASAREGRRTAGDLRQGRVQAAQRGRMQLQHPQIMAVAGHPLQQARKVALCGSW